MFQRLLISLLLACLGTQLVASGGSVEGADHPPGEASSADSTEGMAQTAGLAFTDEGGASAVIPAGSIAAEEGVAVETLVTLEGLPPTGDPAAFAGGIALGPHGLTFETPVVISIPLTKRQTAGREIRLYHWDGTGTVWEETDFFAMVGADGWTASAEVTHFSYYVLQPSQVEAEADGIFGDIAGVANATSSAGGDLAAVTNAAFNEVIAHVNARFPLREPTPLDVPIPNGYNCYAPVGLYFAFDHGGAEGIPRTLVETIGDIDDVEFRIDYLRDVDVYYKQGELENQLAGSFAVNVYWRSTPPTLSLDASRTKLWGGESSSLTATLMCDDLPMENQPIEFSLPIGDASGSLRPASDHTDGSGIAASGFVSDESSPGAVVVEAAYEWSNQQGDVRLEIVDMVDLAVGALTGTWRVKGRERSRKCVDREDNGVYSGSAKVYFEQDGDTFFGFGKFPRDSDVIVGTFERTGPTEFAIEGTSHYVEVGKQADRDDDRACSRGYSCDTWEAYGVATFKGRGSVETQTIDLTWRGHDTEGDTCVFTGKGKATYQSE